MHTFKAIVLSLFVVVVYLFFSYKFSISNCITIFLGEISYEIYLIHGLFLMILKDKIDGFINITFTMSVLSLTIVFAYILNKIFCEINKKLIGYCYKVEKKLKIQRNQLKVYES